MDKALKTDSTVSKADQSLDSDAKVYALKNHDYPVRVFEALTQIAVAKVGAIELAKHLIRAGAGASVAEAVVKQLQNAGETPAQSAVQELTNQE